MLNKIEFLYNDVQFYFRHQEVQLHLQRSLAMKFTPRGNVAGEKAVIQISDEPIPKRKK